MDDLLLIASVWQKQVQSILATESIISIDLIRQQIVMAQFIPLNLMDGVNKLNVLVDKIAKNSIDQGAIQKMETIRCMAIDFVLDHEIVKQNQDMRAQA